MSVTLPNMSLILPTLGADRDTWDDKLNAALTQVDSHNHTAGKGVAVPSAGININADLPFGGFGPTALGKAAFSAVTALSTGARTLFVNVADGELYWRTNGGVNVKLTSGSSLNISLVGGIAGDYTTASAELYYDEASKTYRFTSAGSPKLWARVEAGAFRIAKFGTSAAFYASIEVDNTIAANYTLTLPAAVGAGLMQVSGAGVVSFSYTIPNNTDIVLQGTGKIQHGDRVLVSVLMPTDATAVAGSVAVSAIGTGYPGMTIAVSSDVYCLARNTPEVGKRLKSATVTLGAALTANTTFDLLFGFGNSWNSLLASPVVQAAGTLVTLPSGGINANTAMAAGYVVAVRITTTAGGSCKPVTINLTVDQN